MHPNEQLLTKFYTAFQNKDYATMAACYHDEATFKDSAFELSNVAEVRAMWEMLCKRGKDMRVEFRDVKATDKEGSGHWDAWYTFSKTGRKVHNSVDSSFIFKDGLIVKHTDDFPFYKWSRQALGTPAVLLGWTAFFHRKVRATAMEGLYAFMKEQE